MMKLITISKNRNKINLNCYEICEDIENMKHTIIKCKKFFKKRKKRDGKKKVLIYRNNNK